ncbi:hypothetical protein LTR56_026855 [Elasticomyces elasticus]|nr:hypothetical protein LTR56_026855 [Elasticomyces elasticus]KAK3637887.1 hypothetical protein LTR22_018025 [Elasticomyces elasticus]KAK4908656.1 hypothetical protein LTR49_022468 [Elasticomyces elasticus]KAK5762772.1 hypothetical protein LTS12_007161 [Elasticomyces elasticus]
MARECGTASLASVRDENRTVPATGAVPFGDDLTSSAALSLSHCQPWLSSQCPSLLSLPPSLVFGSESTPVDEGDSLGPDIGNNAGETSVSESEIQPQSVWNNTSATRSSENVDDLRTREHAEEVVYARSGGLYSMLPDADDLAFGPRSDLLTDLAMPASFTPPSDFSVVYAGVIDMPDLGLLDVDNQKHISPAMTMWLRDDSDFLKYKLSHCRRA